MDAEKLPELNLTIDEQTGLLEQDTAAVRLNIDAWKQRALTKVYEDELTAGLEAQAQAQKAVNEAEKRRVENAAKIEDAERRKAEAAERAAEDGTTAANRWNSALQLGMQNSAGMVDGMDELAEASIGVTEEMAALDEELATLYAEQEALDKEIERGNGLIAESEDQINKTADAMEEYTGAVVEGADAHEDLGDSAGDTAAGLETLRDEYQAVRDAARDSIDRQIGLFDDLSGKCEMSTQDMIDALKSQQEAFINYADNIELAMKRGIDEGLVQQLSDGSVESMQILAELVTATDEEIDALNEEFRGVEDAKEYMADGMAKVSDEYTALMQGMARELKSQAYAAGQAVGDGLIEGVRSKAPTYEETVGGLAEGGVREYKEANKIHSPSRRYKELARHDVDGLIVQYREDKTRVEKATAEVADAGYQSMYRVRQTAIPAMASAAAAAAPAGDNRLYGLLGQLLEAVRAGQVLTLDKSTFVGGTAVAYDSKFGQFRALAERGAI